MTRHARIDDSQALSCVRQSLRSIAPESIAHLLAQEFVCPGFDQEFERRTAIDGISDHGKIRVAKQPDALLSPNAIRGGPERPRSLEQTGKPAARFVVRTATPFLSGGMVIVTGGR